MLQLELGLEIAQFVTARIVLRLGIVLVVLRRRGRSASPPDRSGPPRCVYQSGHGPRGPVLDRHGHRARRLVGGHVRVRLADKQRDRWDHIRIEVSGCQ